MNGICGRCRIPPLVVAFVIGCAVWGCSWMDGVAVSVNPALRLAAFGVLSVCGVVFGAGASVAFYRARTSVNPVDVYRASSLVTTGVYRVSRNPMYVSMALMLGAWAVYLSAPVALSGAALFCLYMNYFQIPQEECALRSLFGTRYEDYAREVRRWL